ncbi:tetratricopeptide repeat protein [Chitinophaga sp. S165]|uniref:tetratricopeptide repeat-containing sensor histidine kinase n=1 Tax=Chitinophaga sp. S165 TaxID=2135462 RepID=UPI000D71792B|nr:tetratricopeptide repeat protein [Chitinophaga sp. S165]PWV45561.1 tetratricopeptide repeat protein [Chitinophaga sp. S165]
MFKGYFYLLFVLLLVKGNNILAQDSALVFRTLDSARKLPADTSRVNWLVSKGKLLGRYFDKRGTENLFFQEAITLAQRIKYTRGLFDAYNETGNSKRNKSEYLLAADYHQKAIKYAEDARNDLWLCIALNNTGVDYRRMDDQLEKAFDYHFRALQLAEKINDIRNICIAINSIGNIKLSTEKYAEAINHFEKALELEKQSKNQLGVAINLGNIGYGYQGLGKLDLAIDYYKKSLAVNQQLNNSIGLAICYNSLGSAYKEKKDYARAHEYLNKALEVNDNVDDKVHVAESYLNIGKLWSLQGNHEEANKYFQESIGLSLIWRFKYLLMEAYKAMADDYKARGDFKRSLEAMDRSLVYKDSLLEEQSSLAWAQTQAIYEVDRKDNQIKLLEHDKQMSELRTKRNVVYTLSMAGFVLMVAIGGFFYIRHRNLETNKQTLQLELRSLRAQMNPHFIFNSLSSIHRFIWSNNQEEASDYLTKFSRLMRMILDNTQYTFISLNKELESLRLYVDLEKLRCNDVFDYQIIVAEDINEEEVMIPPMIVQPYVENAIWHGLVHKSGKGLLEIAVSLKGKTLTCTVTDNGIGRKKAVEIKEKKGQTHRSMGMKVTEGRIDLIRKINNTKEADVNITDLEDEAGKAIGTQVKLILPVEFIF